MRRPHSSALSGGLHGRRKEESTYRQSLCTLPSLNSLASWRKPVNYTFSALSYQSIKAHVFFHQMYLIDLLYIT